MNWYLKIIHCQAGFPETVKELDFVKDLGGTTGAVLTQDPQTKEYYVVKKGKHADQARVEYEANKLLEQLGVPVPEAKFYEDRDKPSFVSRFIQGIPLYQYVAEHPEQENEIKAKIQQHFAAHALVGNWDMIGLEDDNILVDEKGNPFYIDLGGSGPWRAMGDPKGERWNEEVSELDKLREKNPRYLGDISDEKLRNQIQQMSNLTPQAISRVSDPNLREMLKKRFSTMQNY